MKKSELLKKMKTTRQELLTLLEGLTPEQMTAPGVEADWSIKDILVHLTLWEAELIKLLYQAGQGLKPTSMHFSTQHEDQINAAWQKEHAGRALELVLADFRSIRGQTLRRVEALPAAEVETPGRYGWMQGKPLADRIASDTCDHDQEHAQAIQAWRSNQGV